MMPAGRPSAGDRTQVAVRFPPEILYPIERLALTSGATRHAVILDLITKGLAANDRQTAD